MVLTDISADVAHRLHTADTSIAQVRSGCPRQEGKKHQPRYLFRQGCRFRLRRRITGLSTSIRSVQVALGTTDEKSGAYLVQNTDDRVRRHAERLLLPDRPASGRADRILHPDADAGDHQRPAPRVADGTDVRAHGGQRSQGSRRAMSKISKVIPASSFRRTGTAPSRAKDPERLTNVGRRRGLFPSTRTPWNSGPAITPQR